MAESPKPYGIVAEFETAADILHAAGTMRDSGFRHWDVFTPFPVHGMDRAMGLKNSKVGWFSFLGGVTGYTSGMLMIWYMNAHDYAIIVGGKPMAAAKLKDPEVAADRVQCFVGRDLRRCVRAWWDDTRHRPAFEMRFDLLADT